MNADAAVEKWLAAALLAYHSGNECSIRAVTSVIIMLFTIIMMIRMQTIEVEMMVKVKVMCVYSNDDSTK